MLDSELQNESENGQAAEAAARPAATPPSADPASAGVPVAVFQAPQVLFQAPPTPPVAPVKEPKEVKEQPAKPARSGRGGDQPAGEAAPSGGGSAAEPARPARATRSTRSAKKEPSQEETAKRDSAADEPEEGDEAGTARKRRRRTSRTRGGKAEAGADTAPETDEDAGGDPPSVVKEEKEENDDESVESGTSRRRRRKRRRGGIEGEGSSPDDPPDTVVHVREAPNPADAVRAIKGSTRLEAKKQRRREGRESGRRRPPIVTEAEFLARRESVERVMVVRQRGERTQIGVLEDDVLVEHYVNRTTHQSYVGNVYLGKVQNVLPSMEAAFVDIGKGRNAVLYAGEVNWDVSGLEGQPKRIESALKPGQSVVVQVTKDPVGHKGARLTSMISLPGRYLVYVPGASMTGISRKLPDTERNRLKGILKKVMPEDGGVIVRTAAEGATEEELARDVSRLAAQWDNIDKKSKTASAPSLLNGEPDLTIRVVRDVFNEDFSKIIVSGTDDWEMIDEYIRYVAPHLTDRLIRWDPDESGDVFSAYRVDEQISKALDRKVWLPSGGSLVIDRTEAMTVIDVNTGKFIGQGGNLEETVTRNNLEAAEEIVRQLRLRDTGGIIVIDFIDMVLESNRDLVLRRLTECLARDRTKHQVAEVTSLGLIQMTRKRIGGGLLDAFSETCECCNGRGVVITMDPPDLSGPSGSSSPKPRSASVSNGSGSNGSGESRRSRSKNNGRSSGSSGSSGNGHEADVPAAPEPEVSSPAESAPAPAPASAPAPEPALATAGAAATGSTAVPPVVGRRTRGGTATVRRSAPEPVAIVDPVSVSVAQPVAPAEPVAPTDPVTVTDAPAVDSAPAADTTPVVEPAPGEPAPAEFVPVVEPAPVGESAPEASTAPESPSTAEDAQTTLFPAEAEASPETEAPAPRRRSRRKVADDS
jgi:ribonuclease E